jgi:2-iminoacetate synthase ThiH
MKVVTYSPSHTVVPTYECFNKCSYCNFRKVPSGDQSGWVNLEEVDRQLRHLAEQGIVSEVLVLSGEVHPGRYVSPNCELVDAFTPFPIVPTKCTLCQI